MVGLTGVAHHVHILRVALERRFTFDVIGDTYIYTFIYYTERCVCKCVCAHVCVKMFECKAIVDAEIGTCTPFNRMLANANWVPTQ